ncbi:hypothetical protein [Streptococcus bovimastitidis]|uniref:hypothetical protein n=1 Tax=Streptococcus bovimastitidis TaxID=1856638 RepID=UPI000AA5C164
MVTCVSIYLYLNDVVNDFWRRGDLLCQSFWKPKWKNHFPVCYPHSNILFSMVGLWGYGFSFRTSLWSVLFAGNIKLKDSLETFFQLCFFLYAIVMLVGSVMDRLRTGQLILLGVLWMTFVYCPLAYLIWNPEGFLAQLGALDFSGGIVVHLSAGVSSLVLALLVGPSRHLHNDPVEVKWHYLGMLLITLGWFGFNAGPVGELNQQAGQVLINSLLAIIAGGLSWSVAGILN